MICPTLETFSNLIGAGCVDDVLVDKCFGVPFCMAEGFVESESGPFQQWCNQIGGKVSHGGFSFVSVACSASAVNEQ